MRNNNKTAETIQRGGRRYWLVLFFQPLPFFRGLLFLVPLGGGGPFRRGGPPRQSHVVQLQHLPFGEQLIESFDFSRRRHPVLGVLHLLIAVGNLPVAVCFLGRLSLRSGHACVRLGLVLLSVSFCCICVRAWGGGRDALVKADCFVPQTDLTNSSSC